MDRRHFLALLVWLIATPTYAQIDRFHSFAALDNNGRPMPFARLCSFKAGTTVMMPVYRTIDTTSRDAWAHANPVIMNERGTATIYLGRGEYRFVLLQPKAPADCTDLGWHLYRGNLVWLKDNVVWDLDKVGETDESRRLRQRLSAK